VRITTEQQVVIKSIIGQYDPLADVFLFGSRTDDSGKGGDIDILIHSVSIKWEDKIKMMVALDTGLDGFPIDLVIKEDMNDLFVRCIKKDLIKL